MNGIGRTIEELTLLFAYAAWRRRYLIALPILIMPFIGIVAAKLSPKDFSTKMTLLVQEPAALNPFLEDLAISTDLTERMDALTEQMRTRTALTDIAAAAGMIDGETPVADIDPVLDTLRRNMRIGLVGQEVVEIGFTAAEAEGLARVVSAVAQRFVDELLAPARSSVEASERFLAEEVDRFQRELTDAEVRLAQFKAANAESLPALHAQNVQALAETRSELATLRAQHAGQEARLESGARRLAETNPIVGRIDLRLAELETRLAELMVRYTDRHSQVVRARGEIEALRERREEIEAAMRGPGDGDPDRLWNMLADEAGESRSLMQDQLALLAENRGRVELLGRQIEATATQEVELAERVASYAAVERRIVALERDVSVKRELLDRLSERYEMARVTGELGREAAPDLVRVIDQPVDPTTSNSWPLVVYVVAGIAGGVALGGGLAFSAELVDTTITRPALIADLVNLPVISRLPPMDGSAMTLDLAPSAKFAPS